MPRHRRVPADAFSAAVNAALKEYAEDVQENLDEIVRTVTKAGVKEMKSAAGGAVGGSGKYVRGWTSRMETGRVSAQGTIYNKDVPGLPHLLEFGHVTRNGTGRVFAPTPAHPHIKEVEERLAREFETKVKSKL